MLSLRDLADLHGIRRPALSSSFRVVSLLAGVNTTVAAVNRRRVSLVVCGDGILGAAAQQQFLWPGAPAAAVAGITLHLRSFVAGAPNVVVNDRFVGHFEDWGQTLQGEWSGQVSAAAATFLVSDVSIVEQDWLDYLRWINESS